MSDHVIVLNRARCRLCDEVIVSTHRHDYVTCECGAISVDGGRAYLRRAWSPFCGTSPQEVIEDMSIVTTTWRRSDGSLVEAYQPGDTTIFCTDGEGESRAEPEDWVVYWPGGGARAYTDDDFAGLFVHVDDDDVDGEYEPSGPKSRFN